jgi:hypothetical protein
MIKLVYLSRFRMVMDPFPFDMSVNDIHAEALRDEVSGIL